MSTAALELASSLQKRYAVDGKRTSIIGISMGAFGAMDWMARKPQMFSSAIAMSGGGDVSCASTLAHSRIWFMHGRRDSVVTVDQTLKMEAAVRKAGGNPRLTVLEELDHGPWDDLAVRSDVLKWLFDDARAIVVASPKSP